MVRPTDEETTAVGKTVCYSVPTRRVTTCQATQGRTRKHHVQLGGRGSGRKMWTSAFVVIFMGKNG